MIYLFKDPSYYVSFRCSVRTSQKIACAFIRRTVKFFAEGDSNSCVLSEPRANCKCKHKMQCLLLDLAVYTCICIYISQSLGFRC